jgi:hypothetical protein
MTDSSAHPELTHALNSSVAFYATLNSVLGDTHEVASHHYLFTQGTSSIAIEHGASVCTLVDAGEGTLESH